MNSQIAGYYRAILYADGQDSRALPKSLMKLHMFAEKRHHALGLGSTITKATALAVSLTWLSGTAEGRDFAEDIADLGDMFSAEDLGGVIGDSAGGSEGNKVDWFHTKPETPVVIEDGGQKLNGIFLGRRGNWLDVMIGSDKRHFRPNQVQLVGA